MWVSSVQMLFDERFEIGFNSRGRETWSIAQRFGEGMADHWSCVWELKARLPHFSPPSDAMVALPPDPTRPESTGPDSLVMRTAVPVPAVMGSWWDIGFGTACVCVCACVRECARARACVCVCVRVCVLRFVLFWNYQDCFDRWNVWFAWFCERNTTGMLLCLVKSKETVGNSWTVWKVILGHKYHNH